MALQPWIANPDIKFKGATTFTPPAYPHTPAPVKLSAPASGHYSDSHPVVGGQIPMHGWRETPGIPKLHNPRPGKRVGTGPAFLDHDDMVKRIVVP